MHYGHMDQVRANIQSTQPPPEPDSPPDSRPTPITDRTHTLFVDLHDVTGKLQSDQTGRFPTTSVSGNSYLMILYDYDSNYIHAEPLKSRSGPHIVAAYDTAHSLLVKRGFKPRLQRLDNEASAALLQYMEDHQVDVQLAPPHVHRRNAAERAIRTFKNHFIAGLSSLPADFPMNLWDRLLPQALLTLNLLRTSRLHPQLSSQAHVHGLFDFNRTPLAPPGIRVLIHVKPTIRGTWAPHAVPGWYLGPALHHYRCYRVWSRTTRAERITDTLAWIPTDIPLPVPSAAERLYLAATTLTEALLEPADATITNLLPATATHALHTLATIFADYVQPPAPPPLLPPTLQPPGPPPMVPPAAPPMLPPDDPPIPPPPDPPAAPLRAPTWADRVRAPPPPLPPRVPVPPPRVSVPLPPAPVPLPMVPVPLPVPLPRVSVTLPSIPVPLPPVAPTEVAPLMPNQEADLVPNPEANLVPNQTATAAPQPAPRYHTRQQAQGGRVGYFNPRTDQLQHWAMFDPPQPATMLSVVDATGKALTYHQLLKGPDGPLWSQGASNEIGRLAQGVQPHMPTGTDTIHFIMPSELPAGRKPTYLRVVAEYKPNKAEKHRIRFTCGGDKVDYPGKVSTETADLATAKCLFNSVISTPGARFAAFDIKNFYLNNPMNRFEYMWIPVRDIPSDIMTQYKLAPLVRHDRVLVEIRKGMYGLPQAGIIANARLKSHLRTWGYHPCPNTPGLFKHEHRPIVFCLVVDDFGIKYVGREHAQHLLDCLQSIYTVTTDWSGTKYCGLTLTWDYQARTVQLSMPGYIAKALHRFQHPTPETPEYSPYKYTSTRYSSEPQLAPL